MKLRDITEARHHQQADFDEIIRTYNKLYDDEAFNDLTSIGGIRPDTIQSIWGGHEPEVLRGFDTDKDVYVPIFHFPADSKNEALDLSYKRLHDNNLPKPDAIDVHFKRDSMDVGHNGEYMVRLFYIRA